MKTLRMSKFVSCKIFKCKRSENLLGVCSVNEDSELDRKPPVKLTLFDVK